MELRGGFAFVSALVLLSFVGCGGGGPSTGRVLLTLQDGGGAACLGANHLTIQAGNAHDTWSQDFWGQFFEQGGAACAGEPILFSGLAADEELTVWASLHDSTTDMNGLLAAGVTRAFELEPGFDLPVEVVLERVDSLPGTLRVPGPPAGWSEAAGAMGFVFRVTRDGETVPLRSGYLDVQPERAADPFPLFISDLPLAAEPAAFRLDIEALANPVPGFDDPPVLRAWSSEVSLGGQAPNPAEAVLE